MWDVYNYFFQQQFVGLPAKLDAKQEANLLAHQREKHTLVNGETVFDVVCGAPVNETNVKALTDIMKQFLGKKEEYHIELSAENLEKLHHFTESVLKLPQGVASKIKIRFAAFVLEQSLKKPRISAKKHPLDRMEVEASPLPPQFVGLPSKFDTSEISNLLAHQREKPTLESSKTVFDAICEAPVNEENVEALTHIMKQFLEKREEYHIELTDENLTQLHQFTQSVLRLPGTAAQTKTVATQFLAALPTQYLAKSFTLEEKNPLDLIFSAQVTDEVQKNVMKKVARTIANQHKAASRDERWQYLLKGSDILLSEMPPLERHAFLDILMHETDYEKAEVAIFKLLREVVHSRFIGDLTSIKPFRLLPKIQFLFPHSPHLIHYFKHVDLVAQFFEYPKPEKPQERAFLEALFKKLQNSGFSLEALEETSAVLGRFLYNQSSPAPVSLTDNFDENNAKLKSGVTALTKKLSELLNAPTPDFIQNLEGLKFDGLARQGDIVDWVSKVLVLPKNGGINRCLINDLGYLLTTELSRFHPSLFERLEKVLIELRDRPVIHDLVRGMKVPTCEQGIEIVRAACKLGPTVPIGSEHISRTLVFALLTDWQQSYFGSCHTTAPIMAISQIALPLIVRDWKEIIQTGVLRRGYEGEQIVFQAPPQLSPVLEEIMLVNKAYGTTELEQFARELAASALFKTVRELFCYQNEQQFIESIVKCLANNQDRASFSCRAIIAAIRPQDFEDPKKFDAILYRLNSLYQQPLLQCWQNCLMGMHYPPLNIPSAGTEAFAMALDRTFRSFAIEMNMNPNRYDENAFREGISNLRFRATPPQDVQTIHATIELYKENLVESLKPNMIDSGEKFQSLMSELFTKITGKKLSRTEQQDLVRTFKIQVDWLIQNRNPSKDMKEILETMRKRPWRFDGAFAPTNSAFYKIYFQTPAIWGIWHEGIFENWLKTEPGLLDKLPEALLFEKWIRTKSGLLDKLKLPEATQIISEALLSEINFTQNLPEGICAFRDWLIQQKSYFGNIEGMMVPSHRPVHVFNAFLSEQMLEDPEPNSKIWLANREEYLENLSWNDPEIKVLEKLFCSVQATCADYLPDDRKGKFNQEIAAIPRSKFLEWYQQFLSVCVKFNIPLSSDSLFSEMTRLSPQLKKKLVYKFANMNWPVLITQEARRVPAAEYYGFALMPTSPRPQWEIVRIMGDIIEKVDRKKDFPSFSPLTVPGKYFETAANPNLLRGANEIAICLKKYENVFASARAALPQDRTQALEALKGHYNSFQKEMNELLKRYDLNLNLEEYAAMMQQKEEADILRPLFAANEAEFEKLCDPILPKKRAVPMEEAQKAAPMEIEEAQKEPRKRKSEPEIIEANHTREQYVSRKRFRVRKEGQT